MSKCDKFRKESLAKAFEGDISNGRTHTFLCVRFQKSECAITLIYQSSYYIYITLSTISLYIPYHSCLSVYATIYITVYTISLLNITLQYHSTISLSTISLYTIPLLYITLCTITLLTITLIYHSLY